jgi:hypothetical protein
VAFLVEENKDFIAKSADRVVRFLGLVDGGRDLGLVGGERPLLFDLLLAPAVHQLYVLVAVVFELPESLGGESVVVVAVEHHLRVVADL